MIDDKDIQNFKLTPQWLAGFFDGEGCIGLYKKKGRNHYELEVKISQKDSLILAFIYIHFPDAYISSGHNVTELRWSSKECQIKFLYYIRDYSMVKRTQIMLAIEFLNNGSNPENLALLIKNEKFIRKERTDFVKIN